MSSIRLRNILLTFALFAITLPTFFCHNPADPASLDVQETSLWKNVYDTGAHYVGMQTCRTCHEPIYQTFIQTGMGQSFGLASKEKTAADFSRAHSIVYDTALDFYYKPFFAHDTFFILEYRMQGHDTVHRHLQQVNYIVGSGQHTNSHIFSTNGYLYQAPITFYTQKHRWDLAPGFEKGSSSRFSRMIQIECMSCHNGFPDFDANSDNKFTSLKTGIDCERCHGPGSLHIEDRKNNRPVDTSKGPDYTIVNPRRLSTELQNNVCQRCHLQGIAVLNDNKSFYDFRPGMKLSEVMNIFMPQYEGARDKMIMASHVERMKKSQCFNRSGAMSCITCHNPHISVKATPLSQYINACNSCHGASAGQHQCAATPQARAAAGNNCITCHMPHNGSIDIPHVAVTDHFIRRRPVDDTTQKNITAFLGLKCFNNPNPSTQTIARGYLEFYERYTQSKGLIDSALHYLDSRNDPKQGPDYVRAWFLLNDFQRITDFASKYKPTNVNDAWTAYRIGEAYYQLERSDSALPWYRRATELRRYSLDFQNKYGICLLALGRFPDAATVFNFIIAQNPDHLSANTNLGFIAMQQGDNTGALRYMLHANELNPDYEQNLLNLAVWYHNNQQPANARKCLEHLLHKHPANDQAKAMLTDL